MVWLTSSYNHKGKSKVQTEHKTQINTSPRNKTKTKGNPITNHQLTTAILFLLFYPYHNFLTPNFRSFYISFFLNSHSTRRWLLSHRALFSPVPCFSQQLCFMLLSPGKKPPHHFKFITLTNPPCDLACIQVNSFQFFFLETVC